MYAVEVTGLMNIYAKIITKYGKKGKCHDCVFLENQICTKGEIHFDVPENADGCGLIADFKQRDFVIVDGRQGKFINSFYPIMPGYALIEFEGIGITEIEYPEIKRYRRARTKKPDKPKSWDKLALGSYKREFYENKNRKL